MDYKKEYEKWLVNVADKDIFQELHRMDERDKEDAFYHNLTFGTGGLRGLIGAGTNRMNVYTVAKATQGLANYLLKHNNMLSIKKQNVAEKSVVSSVVIGYDSRIKSDVFAQVAAHVFAANGIDVRVWSELLPVPMVSYAVRKLGATAGIMITASHNPSKYNGYKVYGPDGCQITSDAAAEILAEIEKLDIFADVKADRSMIENVNLKHDENNNFLSSNIHSMNNDDYCIHQINSAVYEAFIEEIKNQSVLFGDTIDRNVAIVYSPLNGTGLKPVAQVLKETGFTNITVVAEQEKPDGNFPTCPYPNPEIREAMELGLQYCKRINADLLLVTDPDCDRCGIAVKKYNPACNNTQEQAENGENDKSNYQLLTGNEVGLLLLDFICSQRVKHGKMPMKPVFIKTIVTMDLAEKIATRYGVQTINVLTGFKYIGEVIGRLEKEGREADYICGFEESYGYLTGSYVRDKDGVDAAFMICEMFAYYKTRGITLLEKLEEIYKTYGYCLNTLHSYEFEGIAGMVKMAAIMDEFRKGVEKLGGQKVLKVLDYKEGLDGLPSSDVLKFYTKDYSVVIRPSGTEPKLKVYISITAMDNIKASRIEKIIEQEIKERL